MFPGLAPARNLLRGSLLALPALFALSACDVLPGGGGKVGTDEPVPVALLLPAGSGNSGDEVLAVALRRAAELAIADLDGVEIDLRVYNTGTGPDGAAAAAVKAADEGAAIILGPVHAEAANAAGVAVAGRGINVLSFSNNADIAGGNVFVLGPTFINSARRLVGYAAAKGLKRILVVHDATAAGEVGRRAIADALSRTGVALAGTVSYEFSQSGVVAAIPNITSEARSTTADALFLTADAAGALPLLAQMLPEAGLRPDTIRYIGLTRWDVQPATLALPGVQGGWFALPDPGLHGQFQSRFLATYGEMPHPIAGLAYDGIAAIGALVKSGRPDPLGRASLTQEAGFAGVNGVFRLLPDGTNERGLAVAEVRGGQVVVIDPAPRRFGGAGS